MSIVNEALARGAVLLDRPAPPLRHAREIVIAPRLPPRPKAYADSPFTTVGDIVADCDLPGCGWHAMGERAVVKKAIDQHHRLFHPTETVVVKLNHPRQ